MTELDAASGAELNSSCTPSHVAIIMDGNGRWAQDRGKKRHAGHRAGVKSVREVIKAAKKIGVQSLTFFAFSSENWQRPPEEVNMLMDLFLLVLKREVKKLHKNDICLRIIGNRDQFSEKIIKSIQSAEDLTKNNTGLNLFIAADYGGKWDIAQATKKLCSQVAAGDLKADDISADSISPLLSLASVPDPDLFIRTGGEKRISNFLIWQLAYAELYFTDQLWPDFHQESFMQAIDWYATRQRRFGKTGEQVEKIENA